MDGLRINQDAVMITFKLLKTKRAHVHSLQNVQNRYAREVEHSSMSTVSERLMRQHRATKFLLPVLQAQKIFHQTSNLEEISCRMEDTELWSIRTHVQ